MAEPSRPAAPFFKELRQSSRRTRGGNARHARATKVKAACLDSGDVRLGLSRRLPSELRVWCHFCPEGVSFLPMYISAHSRTCAVHSVH